MRQATIGQARIDYAIPEGIQQIWELDTTPQIIIPPGEDPPESAPVHEKFAASMDAVDPAGA